MDSDPHGRLAPAQVLVPAGFLLALLAAALFPYAGVSCGVGAQGHVRVCYTGWHVVSGAPDIDTPNALVPDDLLDSLRQLATLPIGIRLLGILTALVFVVGALSPFVPGTYRRTTLVTAVAATGAVLFVLTAALAAAHAGDVYIYVYADWYAVLGVGDGAGVSGGFWLTLLILVGLAVAGWRLRLAGAELRAPGPDRPD